LKANDALNNQNRALFNDLDNAKQNREQINLEDIQPNFEKEELESTIASLREKLSSLNNSYESLR
jgi:chromosome segregation ATPase